MNLVECKCAGRDRFRGFLVDVAVGVVAELMVAALAAAAGLVF
ncbi:DUF6408 family protein [Streptomyces chilikensis]|uniref:DUF6408 family protein n=1 Tax=Streptomyces chilikensis TaxID=1194079 RepID=A0ABV3EMN1_9ACTN